MSRLLHEREAEVNCTTKSGSTPLHMASESGKTQFVEWLLTVDGNPELRDGPAGDGQTAYEMAKARQHKDVMQLLKPKGSSCCPLPAFLGGA